MTLTVSSTLGYLYCQFSAALTTRLELLAKLIAIYLGPLSVTLVEGNWKKKNKKKQRNKALGDYQNKLIIAENPNPIKFQLYN